MRTAAAASLALSLLVAQSPSPPQGQPPAAARERAYRANNIGVAHLEQFDYPGAERSFREALQIQPDLGMAAVNLAVALFYAGRPEDAAVQARVAAGRLPDSPHAHYVLALSARAADQLDAAVAALTRVRELDPADAGAKIQLGQIYLQQRKFEEAIQLFEEALASEPYNVTAAYSAALALTRAGRAEEGRKAMQRFESLRDAPYAVTYAQTYLGQGRYAEALSSSGAEPDLVSVETPKVRFSVLPDDALSAPGAEPAQGGGLALFDADGDGDLDLAATGASGTRLFRNAGGRFTDESARAGVKEPSRGSGILPGDYDNDGRPDILVLHAEGATLLHQKTDGAFERAPVSLTAASAAATAAFADIDHDGDLDIVVAGSAMQVLRNSGDGRFADTTAEAGIVSRDASAMAAVDVDNGRDIDLVVVGGNGPPSLYRNMRNGTFRDVAGESGLPRGAGYRAVAVGDVNKDRYADLFLAHPDDALLLLSDGRGRFRTVPAPERARGAVAAQFVDYDNDGLLDLMILFERELRLLRNVGSDRWVDVSAAAGFTAESAGGAAAAHAMAVGDLDADGDADVVVRETSGRLKAYRNDGGNANASLSVILAARVSNRSAVGARVEMRAGSLRQGLDTFSSSPAVAPADILFGLGSRPTADVARVLWPSGILQAETSLPAPSPGTRSATVRIEELDRKPSSCPYLFTWNGSRFEFVTDFLGGGEMGAWLAPGVWNDPDPDEYVRIRGDQLQARNGRYELRITNELEEALFVDRLQLLAIDHPAGEEVFPNEGLRSSRTPFRLIAATGQRPLLQAFDGHGHDVRAQLAHVDRRYPDDFALTSLRGYAEPHELILDLGSAQGNVVLLLTGWTDYAFSNDNVAASQRGISMQPPLLQVRDARGEWKTVIQEIGFPVGRPQTVAVDLTGRFLSASREVRIVTNMRIYWDRIAVGAAASGAVRMAALEPSGAMLRWRGLSRETTPDGREPFGYDYARVSHALPWKTLLGRYTREGDVRPLLGEVDDLFVISRPGDEIALSFPALPPVAPGKARTFLLYSHGYSKEMNPRSASPDTVGPLPFRAMSGYPYPDGEAYPRSSLHREYVDGYNTRVVRQAIPSIDSVLLRGAR
jgi:Tfp pilus assembly protein PilF